MLEVADFNTENGASIRLWSYEGQPWQQWIFEEAAEGQYRIKNRFTGKVMDLAMSGVVNGTWVHQWEKTTGKGQRWEIVPADGGKAKIRNVLADKVIDLVGMRLITVPRPRSGRMCLAKTSCGASSPCRISCCKRICQSRNPRKRPLSPPAPRPAPAAPKRPAAKADAAQPSKAEKTE